MKFIRENFSKEVRRVLLKLSIIEFLSLIFVKKINKMAQEESSKTIEEIRAEFLVKFIKLYE